MKKQPTLKQLQDKFIPIYLKQDKPEMIKVLKTPLAFITSIECLLSPYKRL